MTLPLLQWPGLEVAQEQQCQRMQQLLPRARLGRLPSGRPLLSLAHRPPVAALQWASRWQWPHLGCRVQAVELLRLARPWLLVLLARCADPGRVKLQTPKI